MIKRLISAALLVLVGCSAFVYGDDEFKNPKANIPPQGSPQRRNAGEGFPPLPLPATPLRRSERKREPSPPALVGSITFSGTALKKAGASWETTIIDIERWVNFTNDALGQRYRFVQTDFGKFSYDPTELPIIYFTGWKPMPKLDPETLAKLRQYLKDGGTLVIHSNCGRGEFNRSIRDPETGEGFAHDLFPDRAMLPIPLDHPIFSAFHKITDVRLRNGTAPWQRVRPVIETINLGTRAAVIFSPVDLSCGWDANAHPIEGGVLYDQADALRLGANIVTYCLAEYQYARFFDHQKVYHQATDATRDQLVLGQIVHNGDWNPTPHGIPNLLKTVDQSTTLHVQFKCVDVDPAKGDIFSFPVLYMTGERHFSFSDVERKRLREYLDNGGTMVVESAIGNSDFDESVRFEIAKIYPDKKLTRLKPEHAVYNFVYDTRQVGLAPMAKQTEGANRIVPRLEAIEVDGALPVIYSPLSLGAGWEQLPRAYNKGYADEDSLKLGVNILMYEVSH